MVTGDVTVKGKQTLFIYRKAPAGEKQYFTSMIIKSWLVVVPLTGILTVLVVIGTLGNTPGLLVSATGVMMVFAAGVVVFVMGLFLLNPVFSEKSIKLWINVIIVIFVSMGLFAVSFFILTLIGVFPESIGDLPYLLLVQSGLVWLVGVASLFIGRERFIRIE